jgi:pimeloyl-ACP methyl ester carboxylesterase
MANILAVVVTIALLLAACSGKPPARPGADGVELTPLRSIPTLQAKALLRAAGVEGVPVRYAVDLYRMSYSARAADGRVERLSGLIAFPRGAAPRRLVSFQHGTTTSGDATPSRPDETGLAAAIVFAGNGYLLIAPDYPGLGRSPGVHPYFVEDELAGSVTAMIAAAERLAGAPRAPPFLAGFSEGGTATFATLRALEGSGRPVLGSAQVAGAYDLSGLSVPTALKGGAPSDSLYLAYLAWGYADHYGHPLESVLTPEAATTVRRLYGHGAAGDEIEKTLPKDPRAMFRPEALDAIARGGGHWFAEAIAANDLKDFTPRAPVRLYYGARDTDVVPQEALTMAQRITARGGDAQAIDVGPLEHNPSMLAAAPKLFAWLQALERSGGR